MSSINYSYQSRYLENGFNTKENNLDAWNFNQNLYATGFGLTLKSESYQNSYFLD